MPLNIQQQDYNMMSQPYINKYMKLNILNFDMNVVDEISGNLVSCDVSVNADSDLRRSCSVSLKWYRHNNDTGGNDEIVETVIGTKGEIEYNEERWRKLEREGWIPTSPWYVSMCKSFNNDSQKIAQELNVSFLGSSDNVVPVEVIEKQMKSNVIQITDDWKLIDTLVKETWIWKDPIPGHRYICACDPSSGSGEDSTAIQIIDVDGVDDSLCT